MTNYKQLCAELLSELENAIRVIHAEDGTRHISGAYAVINKVKNTLAEPEPEDPTDAEIMELMPQQMHEDLAAAVQSMAEQAGTDSTRAKGMMRIILNGHVVDHARAVLARWGSHVLQPIPVSERLPGPEDCDGQGMCWWWHPSHRESDAPEGWMQRPREWGFVRVRYISDGALVCTHWLPAHALPLPTND